LVSKPLRPPFGDGTSVLVRTLVDALPVEQRLAYFGDAQAPRRPRAADLVIDKSAMGHAPTLSSKAGILAHVLMPKHRRRGLHFFFTPNAVTSQVLVQLKTLGPRRPIIQSVTSSHGVERFAPQLNRLDRVVTMSKHTLGRLEAAGVASSKLQCIYPAVETVAARASRGSRRALYAGDLDVDTARRLVGLGVQLAEREWTLVIACRPKGEGDEEGRRILEAELGRELAAGGVELYGTVDDFEALRLSCEVQLFVADHVRRKVDLPLVLLEGQALLGLDLPPLRELVGQGPKVGRIFGETDLLPGVLAALENESELHAWQEAGPRLVSEHFSSQVMAKQYGKLYRELV
jgi:hypothetical protein